MAPIQQALVAEPYTADDVARLDGDVRRIVARACPAWLRSQQDDLAQQALVRLVRALEKGPGATLNATYLHRAVHSVIVDEMRRRRTDRAEPDDGERIDTAPAPASQSPEAVLAGNRLSDAVHACTEALHATRRPVVLLYLLGHGIAQIAQRLGENAKRVENLLYRGLENLRDCLASKGVTP